MFRKAGMTITLCAFLAVGPAEAYTVYDPWNYQQNLLTATRTLQQINNQVQELQNQAKMLANLNYDSTGNIQQIVESTRNLINQTQGIAYNVGTINDQFEAVYPSEYTGNGFGELESQRIEWLDQTREAQRHAMAVQAQVSENIPKTQAEVSALVSRSNGAQGQTAAVQATNQLLAAISGQVSELEILLMSQTRALNTFIAEQNAKEAQARSVAEEAKVGMADYTPVSTNPFKRSY